MDTRPKLSHTKSHDGGGNMYKILAGDGKKYGPVTAEQVCKWIAQDRANAQTMIQVEGSTEWKPIRTYREFATALATPPRSKNIDWVQQNANFLSVAGAGDSFSRTKHTALCQLPSGLG